MTQQVVNEAADRGESAVTCHSGVAANGLNVIEEREHGVGANILETQGRHRRFSVSG